MHGIRPQLNGAPQAKERAFEHTGDRARAATNALDRWLNTIAPCPWPAHVGSHIQGRFQGRFQGRVEGRGQSEPEKAALYTPEERARRDATPWTLVQAILAPLQFLVFAISLALVIRFLTTGEGYVLATASILAKTFLLYLIMVTGAIWEKVVFGKYLFAKAFFWEDVFSMLVIALQTAYVVALLTGWGSPQQQMMIAIAAYGAYVINAGQFLLKLREARLDAERTVAARQIPHLGAGGQTA